MQQLQLEPLDFLWTTTEKLGNTRRTVTHRPTESFFEVHESHGWLFARWWPQANGKSETKSERWKSIFDWVIHWMYEVKNNHDAPNLWADVQRARIVTDAASDIESSNTPFNTPEESSCSRPG